MTNYNCTPLQAQTPWKPGATFQVGAYFELTAGLALNDTITFQNAITPSGITAIEAKVYCSQLDSNATPLGKFELGDSKVYGPDASFAPARYITGASMGSNVVGQQLVAHSNVAPSFQTYVLPDFGSTVVQVNGVGYNYFSSENSPTNEPGGFSDLILTVTTAPATAAATGTVWIYLTYYCVGNP
jgi:hypothetical protein